MRLSCCARFFTATLIPLISTKGLLQRATCAPDPPGYFVRFFLQSMKGSPRFHRCCRAREQSQSGKNGSEIHAFRKPGGASYAGRAVYQ